jgi:hypothetical protein
MMTDIPTRYSRPTLAPVNAPSVVMILSRIGPGSRARRLLCKLRLRPRPQSRPAEGVPPRGRTARRPRKRSRTSPCPVVRNPTDHQAANHGGHEDAQRQACLRGFEPSGHQAKPNH